jgi:hypothetical protein
VFGGAAQLTTVDPSHEYCQFKIGTNITQAIGLKAFVTGDAPVAVGVTGLCTALAVFGFVLCTLL